MTAAEIASALGRATKTPSGWHCLCPAHPDHNPSLDIDERGGRVLWTCRAGCSQDTVTAALRNRGLLNGIAQKAARKPRIVKTYDYVDDRGELLFQVCRFAPKTFRQRRPDNVGGWIWNLQGVRRVPYHLPELLAADPKERVYIVEGEKDADTLETLGLVATCNPGGAGKWRSEYGAMFARRSVVVIPDNDAAGEKHAQQVAAALLPIAEKVQIVRLPDLPAKGDVSDWLAAGGTREALEALPTTDVGEPDITNGQVEWQAVIPLAGEPGPPLCLAFMPAVLAGVVEAISTAIQAPLEPAWGVAVAVVAAAIGRRAKVKLSMHCEPSPLWTATVLPPGSRKSAVLRELARPLLTQEVKDREAWRKKHATWRAKAAVAEECIRTLKRDAAKLDGDDDAMLEKIVTAQTIIDAAPPRPTLWTSDTTPEELRRLLEANGSVAIVSAEGASLLDSFGRYTGGERGADLAIFLAAHAGDADRATRVSGEHGTEQALASVAVTIQPDVLATARGDKLKRSRGLLDRFLWLMPADPRGTRDYSKHKALPAAIVKAWEAAIAVIFKLPAAKPGEPIPTVSVDKAAGKVWRKFAQGIENRQAPDGDLRSISGWASKLAGQVGRIALAYHLIQGRGTDEAIDEATMTAAIGIGLQLIGHAKAAFTNVDETTHRARLVLECIRRHKPKPKILTPRYVVGKGWGGCRDVDTARKILHLLAAHHFCRPITRKRKGDTGAQPKDAYAVTPATWGQE